MHNYSCLQFKKNVNSQNGEDGIIEYIFDKIGTTKGNFIEFGAWDGKHLSNCLKLFHEGWSGIYIEADESKFEDLTESFGGRDGITLVNKMVSYEENDNLDTIIDASEHKNKDFDFVSIDVDGLDYNIFKAMKKYLPKVICIEVNAGHSPLYDREIPISIAQNNIGQSMKIICDEADKKGYFPLCYTGNLFLIKNEYRDLFLYDVDGKGLKDLYVEFLSHLDEEAIKYLFELFVISKHFNGFSFENDVLKDYCIFNKVQEMYRY